MSSEREKQPGSSRKYFNVGDRVRIRQDKDFPPGPWPGEPLGRVSQFAQHHLEMVKGRDVVPARHYLESETTLGPLREYFVVFDEPQLDADGDGPFESATILEIYIEPVAPHVAND
jgi:hypothetical protein